MPRFYVTTSTPDPVRADVLARHRRLRGDRVRFLLVSPTPGARDLLALSSTDTVTPDDPAHRQGVTRLWRACAAAGDLSRGPDDEWTFRLSRHTAKLRELITTGELRVEPATHRAAILALLATDLPDVRAATPGGGGANVPDHPAATLEPWWDAATAITGLGYGTNGPHHHRWWLHGDRRAHVVEADTLRLHAVLWPAVLLSAGLPPPTDIYVHEPTTATAPAPTDPDLGPDVGLDVGLDLATLTALADRHGPDAVRWWLLRDTQPLPSQPPPGQPLLTQPLSAQPLSAQRLATQPFAVRSLAAQSSAAQSLAAPNPAAHPGTNRLITLANNDLSGTLGGLVDRVTTMVHRYRAGRPPTAAPPPDAGTLLTTCRAAPELVHEALAEFDFRQATDAVWRIVEQARRYADRARPWDLARADRAGDRDARDRLDGVLATLLTACRVLATELTPFLPTLAAGIAGQCITLTDSLAAPRALFPRR